MVPTWPPFWLKNICETGDVESRDRAGLLPLGLGEVVNGRRVAEPAESGAADAADDSAICKLPLFSPAARRALRSTTSASLMISCTAAVVEVVGPTRLGWRVVAGGGVRLAGATVVARGLAAAAGVVDGRGCRSAWNLKGSYAAGA